VINGLSPEGPVTALLAGTLVLFITGSTEPSPTYFTPETLLFAMLLLSTSAGLAMQPVEAPSELRRANVHSPSIASPEAAVSVSMSGPAR
jgi:hypothetical protein